MTKLIRSEESKLACEQYSQSQTKLLTESIVSWYSSAISLERGALLIWEQVTKDCKLIKDIENMPDEINPSLTGTFMLLAGLSVENLLKANCIKSSGAWGKTESSNLEPIIFQSGPITQV